jgi:hypothetical protein
VASSFAIDDQIGNATTSCDLEGETISAIIQNIGDMALDGTGNIRVAYYDLYKGWPVITESEIVWESEFSVYYFIKVRTTTCDEDLDSHCYGSPDGVGLSTDYTITLEEY